MNENNSKIVEYVLVILIALGVSYAVFAQASAYENRFGMIEKSIKDIQTKIQSIDVDTIVNQLKIKGIEKQVIDTEPKPVEPAPAETEEDVPAPTPAPTPAPVPAPTR